jgi:hypothetical protein
LFLAAFALLAATLVCAAPTSVKTVSYSTGVTGRQLKWLPAIPSAADGVVQAAVSEPIAPGGGSSKVRRADGDVFTDPFEDVKSKLQAGPSAKPGSSSSEKSSVMPPLGSAAPKLPLDAPKNAGSAPAIIPPTRGPGIEKQLQVTVAPRSDECPDPNAILLPLTKKDILDSVKPKPGEFPKWCKMGKDSFVPRSWEPSTFHWTASALCHRPVYFEDLQLERYGHVFGPWLQSVASGGHFFLSVPALPYAVGLFPPNECIYTLGYYRPGSCTPYMFDALPLSIRGILYEGGVWTGMAFLIP